MDLPLIVSSMFVLFSLYILSHYLFGYTLSCVYTQGLYQFLHIQSIKKSIFFFSQFTWYQSHGLSFCRVLFSSSPLLRLTFSFPVALNPVTSTSSWNTSEALDNVALSSASDRIKYIFITSMVHMTYML